MSIQSETPIDYIYKSYETGNYKVSFKIEFGPATDSAINSDNSRKKFTQSFNMNEVIIKDNDCDIICYKVIGKESPLSVKISDIIVINTVYENCKYGIGFALDLKKPEFNSDSESEPNNIERDGHAWHLDANTNACYYMDQNASGCFQYYLKTAKNKNETLSDEEYFHGVEETTDETGLLFLTFMICQSYEPKPTCMLRSLEYKDARIAYGSGASTNAKSSSKTYVNVPRYTLPVRFKVYSDCDKTDVFGAKDLEHAIKVEELQKQSRAMYF